VRQEDFVVILPYGSGILLHISSLPSPFGIGDLGTSAYYFADLLRRHGLKVWQVLPLNPTGRDYGHSPYQSSSAFAGNPLFISPDILYDSGLLDDSDRDRVPEFSGERVDFSSVTKFKEPLLFKACERFILGGEKGAYEQFCTANGYWLEDYSLFVALQEQFPGRTWNQWPDGIRDRIPDAISGARNRCKERIEQEMVLQFFFHHQWTAFKRYCAGKGLVILGDLPLYVHYNSADVWSHPELFNLDPMGNPRGVAGVPPDYFSSEGQLWGNPVFRWDAMKKEQYDWWVQRFSRAVAQYDMIRIDHFRGFQAYWEVPPGEKTAVTGIWVPGPGADFFTRVFEIFPGLSIVAEDLGYITPAVTELMNRFHLPGMRVLLFGFHGDPRVNPNHPANIIDHCVVYTGTHDNNTVKGWFEKDASGEEKRELFRVSGRDVPGSDINKVLISLATHSPARLVIIPVQDILGLGSEARMNRPGSQEGNWTWRISPVEMTHDLDECLHDMPFISARKQLGMEDQPW
jgi:4-alpha-glucanotransferase